MKLATLDLLPSDVSVLLLLLPAYLAAILAHEIGHAVAGRLCGYVVTSSGSGFLRPLLVLDVRGTRFYACRSRPLQGMTFFWIPQLVPSRFRLACALGGGILANGLLAMAALALLAGTPWCHGLWQVTFAVNAFAAVVSLIPLRFQLGQMSLRTDGMLMFEAIRDGTVSFPVPHLIESSLDLRPHLEAIGDSEGVRLTLLNATVGYLELGDPARAGAIYREVESRPPAEVPAIRAWQSLVGGMLATRLGDRERASLLVDAAGGEYRALAHAAGSFLVSLHRAELKAADGDLAGHLADLDALASGEAASRHPSLRTRLLAARLESEAIYSDVAEPAALVEGYERLGKVHVTPALDLRFYRAVARACLKRGDEAGAERAHRRALAAVKSLADLWVGPQERAHFLDVQAPLLAEIRENFEARGKVDETAALLAPLEAPHPAASVRAESASEREARLRRRGMRVLGLNVIVIFLAIVGLLVTTPSPEGRGLAPIVVPVLMIAMFTGLALVYAAFHFTIGRFIPALRRSGGAVILILALAGWGGWLIAPVLFLLDGGLPSAP
ncbi:hypothetical protein OJF2_35280 [Aquisphaera giovannonii]|uniref:Peptidase M50 domain-containing protein n=1 Tax=Aquisphaera giovannonii TaxID=406548 RepID=A0A5B9W2Y0_9BACT|nr:site-2 protease family protein [Aquisphaera giovannonii]QEH34983.1 hypothetical protein OJF2_35280 [Aquisphaera giovannonii]